MHAEGNDHVVVHDDTIRNKDVVEHFLRALVQHDTATMRRFVRDDVVWWSPQSVVVLSALARPMQGWDDVPWLGGGGARFFVEGSSAIVIHHLVAEGDLVAADYNRVAQRVDGGDYDAEYNLLFRLVDGRVAEVWEILDTASALAAG